MNETKYVSLTGKETNKEKEKWIVEHIRPEYRNGYREVLGLPVKVNEDEVVI